jgi:large subunit ribosomal protein L6
MSRIGDAPVALPSGVSVKLMGSRVEVKGPKGVLTETLPEAISVEVVNEQVGFKRANEKTKTRALHGLARALVNNMVVGVTEGFKKELEIQGVGYRADTKGKTLNLSLGFSHPVAMPVPEGLSVSVTNNTMILIEGIDKAMVGQFAANVRSKRPPEPYKGKGIRYLGEHVRRKVGKTGAA